MTPEARDSLLNAERHTGGRPGVTSPEVLAELRQLKLLSPKGNLTAAGARAARKIQEEDWGPYY